jgi:hypothetical protein
MTPEARAAVTAAMLAATMAMPRVVNVLLHASKGAKPDEQRLQHLAEARRKLAGLIHQVDVAERALGGPLIGVPIDAGAGEKV